MESNSLIKETRYNITDFNERRENIARIGDYDVLIEICDIVDGIGCHNVSIRVYTGKEITNQLIIWNYRYTDRVTNLFANTPDELQIAEKWIEKTIEGIKAEYVRVLLSKRNQLQYRLIRLQPTDFSKGGIV